MADNGHIKAQLETQGAALAEVWGGPKKQKYYTPDGREVWGIPAVHDYVVKDRGGKVIESGTRDANYDKGWLPLMPTKRKVYCPGCDKWHNTKAQVATCVAAKRILQDEWERKAQRMMKKDNGKGDAEIAELKDKIDRLEALVSKLVEAK